MQNLEALNVICPQKMSHIEIKNLLKLKWLRFQFENEKIPQFHQANPNLKVLELHQLKSLKIYHQIFNFRKLEAFSFTCYQNYIPLEKQDFDLDWLSGKNLDDFKPKIEDLTSDSASASQPSCLRYLNLKQIKSLKGSFSSLVNLLSISLNYISSIKFQPDMFNGLASLKFLHISNSTCSMLSPDLFNGLVN